MFPCARCATLQKTCCQTVNILVTQGDVARIAAHTGRADFWERRRPCEDYQITYSEDDPNWIRYTVTHDGERRELKRRANGDCTFLGEAGCTLPMEVRPLICRLYPLDYNEKGITGEVPVYCPTEVLAPAGSGLTMLTVLGVRQDDGERWRSMLYQDLRAGNPCLRIGLTYDLKEEHIAAGLSEEAAAEFDRPETIEALERTLRELGHAPERIGHIRTLTSRLARGDRWDLVWNIAEGLHGIGREAQVPALLDAYQIPYTFSDPMVLSLTLHKGMTKRIMRDLGVPTPDFVVIQQESDLAAVKLPFPLFVKPVAEGSSKGISGKSLVHTRGELTRQCLTLLETFQQPVLVETFLPGREFTVGIIGTGDAARIVGMMEVLLGEQAEAGVYSYDNKELYEGRVTYAPVTGPLYDEAAALCLKAWRGLGCRDAGRIDLRADAAGRLSFIEVNPLPGINPIRSDLTILCGMAGIDYQGLLTRILESALQRMPHKEFTPRMPTASTDGTAAKRVLILRDSLPEDPLNAVDDIFVQTDAIRSSLHELGHTTAVAACTMDLGSLAARLRADPPDLVFNLVESLEGRGRLTHLVPSLLDELRVPYTGSPAEALFVTGNKVLAKGMMRAAGIPTPDWHTHDTLRTAKAIAPARYILKSVWEHASHGLGKDSVIEATSAIQLAEALDRRRDSLGGEGFAEMYIHGRELRVSMLGSAAGPQFLPISEIVFEGVAPGQPQVDTHAAKWENTASNDYLTTTRQFAFAASDQALLAETQRLARAVWSLFGLRGYARLDLRVDEQGRPWVIDVNANPSLAPLAGYAAGLEQAGIPFTRGMEQILAAVPAPAGVPA